MADTRTFRELDEAQEWPTDGAAERLIGYVVLFGDGIIDSTHDSDGEEFVVHSRDIDAIVCENERLRAALTAREGNTND